MKIKEFKRKVRTEADNLEINDMSNVVKATANDTNYNHDSVYKPAFGRKEIVTLVTCSLSIVLIVLVAIFVVPKVSTNIAMSKEVARPLGDVSAFDKIRKETKRNYDSFKITDLFNIRFNKAAAPDASAMNSESSNRMSDTISQVEGIQEGEIVKLDGNHIYYIYLDSLQIYTIENNKASLTKEIKLNNHFYRGYEEPEDYVHYAPVQMYVTDERIIVITESPKVPYSQYRYFNQFMSLTYNTVVSVYDKEEYNCVKEIVCPGKLIDGRVYEDNLYFVSAEYVEDDKIHSIIETNNNESKVIEFGYDDVLYVPAYASLYENYICSVNLATLDANYECQLGESSYSTIYMSTNALYICASKYIDDEQHTLIYKYALDENKNLKYSSCGCIKGYVLNQYSLDEYNGYLRVAAYNVDKGNFLSSNYVNAVYVLKEEKVNNGKVLIEAGKLDEGIGYPGERIKSVKFNGEYVSIVTYRNTDPLYLIKFTNDTKIEIVDYLKVPGYSSYLLDVTINNNNYKLGIGYTDDEFSYKVSLYSEANEDVIQIGEDYVIERYKTYQDNEDNYYINYTYTTASDNIRTMFLYQDSHGNLFIGMNLDHYHETKENNQWNITKDGAYLLLRINPESEEVISKVKEFETSSISSRLVAIGDYYYVVSNMQVLNYKYNANTDSFEEIE